MICELVHKNTKSKETKSQGNTLEFVAKYVTQLRLANKCETNRII